MTRVKRLRPHSHLFREGIIAVILFMAPVFVVLYVITLNNGHWLAVFVLQVIVTLLVVLAAWGYFGVAIWVSPEAISERGFFGRKTTFAREQLGSIVIAETQTASSAETTTQLFVCDEDGKGLVRMRGQFWSRENMELVRTTLDLPATEFDEAVTTRELRRDFPQLLYGFERHPVLALLSFTVATVVVAGLVMAFLFLAGVR